MAQKGRYWMDSETGDRYLVLEEGKVTDVAPGQLDLRVLSFARNDLRLPEPEFRKRKSTRINSKSIGRTTRHRQYGIRRGIAMASVAGYQCHHPGLAGDSPIALGARVKAGVSGSCSGSWSTFFMAICYTCAAPGSSGGVLPTYIGMWWVHVVFLIIGFIWIRRQGRFPVRANSA